MNNWLDWVTLSHYFSSENFTLKSPSEEIIIELLFRYFVFIRPDIKRGTHQYGRNIKHLPSTLPVQSLDLFYLRLGWFFKLLTWIRMSFTASIWVRKHLHRTAKFCRTQVIMWSVIHISGGRGWSCPILKLTCEREEGGGHTKYHLRGGHRAAGLSTNTKPDTD